MKLVLQGFSGKMGKVVYEYLQEKGYTFAGLFDEKHKIQEKKIAKCDAIIDFSTVESAKNMFNLAIKYHKPIIIGVTGFTSEDLEMFDKESLETKISVYVIYNFLISIQRLKEFIEALSDNYDKIYIEDIHNVTKKDAPSGTTKFLIDKVEKNKLEVSSIRTNYFTYEHKIRLFNEFESLEITHKCYNKLGYAKGVEIALTRLNTFVGLKRSI